MSVDLGFPLTLDYVRGASSDILLTAIKQWLEQENPICLLHPHGFYVVLLGRNETEEWRFHFWPQGSRVITGMPAFIHTHDRHIESRILQGQLTNILYAAPEVPIGGQPLYVVSYVGDRYMPATSNLLRNTTIRVQPVIRHRDILNCGDMYHVERHEYHEAVVSEQTYTATLVCMHSPLSGAVKVIGLDEYPDTITFMRDECRAKAFAEKITL
jgi:hypothetical protein